MTRTELVCNVIVMAVCFLTATKILANIVREGKVDRILDAVVYVIFAVYSSFGFATLLVYYESVKFELWLLALLGVSIFGAHFTISACIGLFMKRRDEERKWKSKFKREENKEFVTVPNLAEVTNSCMVTKGDNIVNIENYCRVDNACTTSDARNGKRRRRKK